MTESKRTIGVLLRQTRRHGTLYVEALLVTRKGSEDAPLGATDGFRDEWPKWLRQYEIDGLGMYGFVSDMRDDDGKCRFIGGEIEYRDVYAIHETKARLMAKTLKRINVRIERDRATEPGDRLANLCAALKLDFVVEDRERFRHDPDRRWLWLTPAEGKNRYRQLIDEAEQEETTRLGPRAVAR